jgi:hypothetical protein
MNVKKSKLLVLLMAFLGWVVPLAYATQFSTYIMVYDPSSDQWSTLSESRSMEGQANDTVLLPTGDLLAGKSGIFSIQNRVWTKLESPTRYHDMGSANLILRPDRKVLSISGWGVTNYLVDPLSDETVPVASMRYYRLAPKSLALQDGRVFVYGGTQEKVSAGEIYDPTANRWSVVSAPHFSGHDLCRFGLTLLLNGEAMIAGGSPASGCWANPIRQAMIFDPIRNRIRRIKDMPIPREAFLMTTLKNGKVLVAGGINRDDADLKSYLYDPKNDSWQETAKPNHLIVADSYNEGSALAQDAQGKVYVFRAGAGDRHHDPKWATLVESYDPATGIWTERSPIPYPVLDPKVQLMPDGRFIVMGYWWWD